ncbi:HNH endonuclease [Mariniflexile maritimum]|uniref:HNH endonuclease n=1 Tax=Mariniflexile maritimum TaxID=2682493 RepID=UPI0012F64F46|nr:HNH endonuclease [Mariniflexile maritimum]
MKKFEELRFFSKPLLKEANYAAHREKRSKCINPELIENLSLNSIYHVLKFWYHKKNELRLFVEINDKGEFELLDTSITRYESLPIIRYFDNGKYEIDFQKRPYPNGREWQETEIKKPVRKQSKFRKNVLEAYSNCCAVCDINQPSLIRAAHILNVKDGGPDTINNGIALCVNHEIAFDIGILTITTDYKVKTKNDIGVQLQKLKLPKSKNYYPNKEYLKKKNEIITAANNSYK